MCALVILALLVSGFVVNYIVIRDKSQILTEKMEALKNAIDTEDEKRIDSSYQDIVLHWKKHIKYMLMFSNHGNLDNISLSMIVIEEKLKAKEYTGAKEEIALVISTLSGISQNETLCIENIF